MNRHPTSGSTAETSHLPGSRGMWAGILAEMTEFGLLFGVYIVARYYNPEAFHLGPEQVNTLAGTANTVMMISGSYFVVKSVQAVQANNQSAALGWLWSVFATIIGYGIIKTLELSWNIDHNINGRSGIYFTVYYYLTLTHMVHVFWAGIGLLWILFRTYHGAYNSRSMEGLESFASYWHATDLVWLIIFPLLYLLR